MTKISVIIPCYNSGEVIKHAIDSIFEQTYKDFEIIVVNDGSDDSETIQILENLSNDIKVINQSNKGLSAARNTGAQNAKGKYILPLDCDDYLSPNFLEKMIDKIKVSENLAYVFSDIKMFGEKKGILNREYNYFVQLFTNQLPYCLLMDKKLWREVGGYDEKMKLGYEDWEFNIRLGKNGYYGLRVNEPLFNYRVSSQGMMKSKSDKNYIAILRQIRSKHKDLYSLSSLYHTWSKWRNKTSPYPIIFYIIMYLATKYLPGNIYNIFYKRLSFLKQSERISVKNNKLFL